MCPYYGSAKKKSPSSNALNIFISKSLCFNSYLYFFKLHLIENRSFLLNYSLIMTFSHSSSKIFPTSPLTKIHIFSCAHPLENKWVLIASHKFRKWDTLECSSQKEFHYQIRTLSDQVTLQKRRQKNCKCQRNWRKPRKQGPLNQWALRILPQSLPARVCTMFFV